MNLPKLYNCICDMYLYCGINSFPINCFEVGNRCGYQIKKYSDLNSVIRNACKELSEDACLIDETLYYEEAAHPRRITFSIMHELGHVFLDSESENDADEFASHFLAPRILIHKYGYRTAEQIHDAFGLSYAAANRALVSYREWYQKISRSAIRKPSEPELQLEQIFFPVKETVSCCNHDDKEYDTVDKYFYILRVLKAGLPIPPEYQDAMERYRRMGLRFI